MLRRRGQQGPRFHQNTPVPTSSRADRAVPQSLGEDASHGKWAAIVGWCFVVLILGSTSIANYYWHVAASSQALVIGMQVRKTVGKKICVHRIIHLHSCD